MATDNYDDSGVKSETKSGFSFRKMFKRWADRMLPDRGSSTVTRAGASGEPGNSNPGMKGGSVRPRESFVLPEIDFGSSFLEMNGMADPNRPADLNKPLPALPSDRLPPEELLTASVAKIIARQAAAFRHASDKLGLGMSAPLPTATEKLPAGVGRASELQPRDARLPPAATEKHPTELQDEPSAVGQAHTAIAVNMTLRGKPAQIAILPKEQRVAGSSTISRSSSISSVVSRTSIDSTFSAVSAMSTDTAATSTSAHSSVAAPEHTEPSKDMRTRLPAHELYPPENHLPSIGR